VTRQQNGIPGKKINTNSLGIRHDDSDDDSMDELSAEYSRAQKMHKENANGLLITDKLLTEHNNFRGSPSSSKERGARMPSSHFEESSDEESTKKKADIQRTDFSNPKKAKPKKVPGQHRYDVVSLFSESEKWLVGANTEKWCLEHDTVAGKLMLVGPDGQTSWTYPTSKIEKIEFENESSKMVVHKPRDMSMKSEINFCLELKDADQAYLFRENLKSKHATISMLRKPPYVFAPPSLCMKTDHTIIATIVEKSTSDNKSRKRRTQRGNGLP